MNEINEKIWNFVYFVHFVYFVISLITLLTTNGSFRRPPMTAWEMAY